MTLPLLHAPSLTLAVVLAVSAQPCRLSQAVEPQPTPSPTATPIPPETTDDLFDSTVLHDFYLSMNPADLDALREHFLDNTYYAADLKWRSISLRNVAVRSRGFSSRSATKPGLYIDMNRETPGQTFLGLKGLVLDNLLQDTSMMREAVAMTLFARMGEPASRIAFCRLYLNSQYEGLFLMVENIDKPFLQRTYGRDDGYLFEYKWVQRFDGEYLGDYLGLYRPLFEAKTYSNESDFVLYEPVRALFQAVNAPEDVLGRDALSDLLDLRQFVRLLAVEKVMTEADGLAGYWGMDNFYLYRDKNTGRHSFLVWDRDRSLWPELVGASIFHGLGENRVAQRALGYGDLYALYLQTAEETASVMQQSNWMVSEIDRLWSLVRQAAHEDTHKPYSNEEADSAVEWLRQIVIERADLVTREVGSLRADGRRETRRPQ